MAMKPVNSNIKVVLGPAIDDTDFKTPVESLVFNSAGMELDVILEKTDGTVVHTDVVPTAAGDYDWAPADQGYYELELPRSNGVSFNNDMAGNLTVVANADGVMPFRSVAYDVVPRSVYEALVEGTEELSISLSDPEQALAALTQTYYGSVVEANAYFAARLHERAWSNSDVNDRPKALWAATLIIDALNFKGYKSTVYTLLQATSNASDEQIREAEAAQALEFPRGADTDVPSDIRMACYEIAYALLDGKDPELELENLGIISQSYAAVRTSYSRNQVPIEHIINGIPSSQAWRWLRPFLREDDAIVLARVS